MGWRNLVEVRVNGWGLDVHLGLLLGVLIAAFGLFAWLRVARRGGWRVTRANFTFAGCGLLEICPEDDVARIAHQAWVELTTRKAAIPFDLEHDVITEVYDSWYELFRALRELTKSVRPGSMYSRGGVPALADVLIRALNEGLRPHLTQWQARFRSWYESEVNSDRAEGRTPQQMQRNYPEYDALVADLLRVNAGLIEFATELRRIAHDRKRSWNPFQRRPQSVPGGSA